MKELQRLTLNEKLLNKIKKIDEELDTHIKQFVHELQTQRNSAIGGLIEGYLADKDYPENTQIKLEGNEIIFYDKEEPTMDKE